MFNSAPSLRTLGLIALTLALAATACKNEIIGGNGGEAGDGGTGGVIDPPPPTLVVGGVAEYNNYYGGAGGTGGYYGGGGGDPGYGGYYGGQGGYYPGDTGGWGSGGWGTGGYYGGGGCGGSYGEGGGCGYPDDPYPSGMLFLKIGNYAPTCGDSYPPSCVSPASWQVTIGLPYYMQGPGLYSLSDPSISSNASASGQDPDYPDACWGSGGSFEEGTLQVLSNDGSIIVVRLNGTQKFEFNADGQYVLPICPTYDY